MKVYREISEIEKIENVVLTIGSFDGVHKGHQKILNSLIDIAKTTKSESVVLTFDPHPRQILAKNNEIPLQLINSPEEKIKLLESLGIDHLVIIPFTIEFSQLSPLEYIEDFIIKYFSPSMLVIGYDHHFGKNREGNFNSLLDYVNRTNAFQLKEIPAQDISEITVSSTKIRNAILQGEIEHANKLLGYEFSFEGKVVNGEKVGTSLGFPTANVIPVFKDKIVPGLGIYTAKVIVEDQHYNAMMYIGLRPTINSTNYPVIEVNIFDFKQDIYDKNIQISIFSKIRGEQKFNDLEELKIQLLKDKGLALEYFKTLKREF